MFILIFFLKVAEVTMQKTDFPTTYFIQLL